MAGYVTDFVFRYARKTPGNLQIGFLTGLRWVFGCSIIDRPHGLLCIAQKELTAGLINNDFEQK